jgi:hypothetical protein
VLLPAATYREATVVQILTSPLGSVFRRHGAKRGEGRGVYVLWPGVVLEAGVKCR